MHMQVGKGKLTLKGLNSRRFVAQNQIQLSNLISKIG